MLDWGLSQQAEKQLGRAAAIAEQLNEEHLVEVLLMLASSCLAQRKWSDAEAAIQRALEQANKEGSNPAEPLVILGLTALGQGDSDRAIAHLGVALEALAAPEDEPAMSKVSPRELLAATMHSTIPSMSADQRRSSPLIVKRPPLLIL